MKRILIFLLAAVSAYGASEPILLDTKSHKFISPFTVDFAGVTVLNFPGGGGGGVTSFNGRTGVVVPLSPDYAAFYAPIAAALPTGGNGGDVLQKNSTTNYDAGWQSLTTQTQAAWGYKTNNAMADPGSGNMRTNTSNWSTSTQMALSQFTSNNLDRTALIMSMAIGDQIYMQDTSNTNNWVRYKVTSLPVNNTTWFQVAVSSVTAGSTPGSQTINNITFTATSYAVPPVSSVFGRAGAVVAAANDYSFSLLSGNIAIAQMNSGTGASSTTFWRGDNTWATPAGGGGTPGGVDTNIQYNSSGAFGGDANFTYNKSAANPRITIAAGSAGYNGLMFGASSGIFSHGLLFTAIDVYTGSAINQEFTTSGVSLISGNLYGWSSSASDPSIALDTALARNAAGIVEINNGTVGTYRDIKSRYHFLALQASPAVQAEGALYGDSATHKVYYSNGSSWVDLTLGGAGGGTVTSFSAGNLAPIFTSTVTNATTTPAHTFTLSNTSSGHQFLGNNTSGAAAPAYVQPSINDLANLTTTSRLLGSNTLGSGVGEISLGTGLSMTAGGVLNATGQSQATFANNAPAQAITASTDTYITNSGLSVPSTLRVSAKFLWHIRITKTAAGTATATWSMRFGTNGTTADTAQATATTAAQGSNAVTEMMEITAYVTAVGATGNIVGQFEKIPGAAGANGGIGPIAIQVASGNFDTTVGGSIIGISVNTGAAAAWTIDRVITEIVN